MEDSVMKPLKTILITGLIAGMVAAPAFAFEISTGTGQTFGDFQRLYSGTKPIVAFDKYASVNLNEKGQTTLEIPRMRTEVSPTLGQGTKPMILPKMGTPSRWVVGTVTPSKPWR
jgi:hypothetical protein